MCHDFGNNAFGDNLVQNSKASFFRESVARLKTSQSEFPRDRQYSGGFSTGRQIQRQVQDHDFSDVDHSGRVTSNGQWKEGKMANEAHLHGRVSEKNGISIANMKNIQDGLGMRMMPRG